MRNEVRLSCVLCERVSVCRPGHQSAYAKRARSRNKLLMSVHISVLVATSARYIGGFVHARARVCVRVCVAETSLYNINKFAINGHIALAHAPAAPLLLSFIHSLTHIMRAQRSVLPRVSDACACVCVSAYAE